MSNQNELLVAPIRWVNIFGTRRVATVRDPHTGENASHGIGSVGAPIRPYLGHRAEGYMLALPEDLDKLRVWEIHEDQAPDAQGFYPKTVRSAAALEAPDLAHQDPSVSDVYRTLHTIVHDAEAALHFGVRAAARYGVDDVYDMKRVAFALVGMGESLPDDGKLTQAHIDALCDRPGGSDRAGARTPNPLAEAIRTAHRLLAGLGMPSIYGTTYTGENSK